MPIQSSSGFIEEENSSDQPANENPLLPPIEILILAASQRECNNVLATEESAQLKE